MFFDRLEPEGLTITSSAWNVSAIRSRSKPLPPVPNTFPEQYEKWQLEERKFHFQEFRWILAELVEQ